MIKPRAMDSGSRLIKSSKARMTTDLVNLINQTKKDVENLRAHRRNSKNGMKSNTRQLNYVSPLGDRSKDDAYGFSDTNKKLLASTKSDKLKLKKKRIANGSNSSRKNKVKTKISNYQPVSGQIDLVSKNERSVTQTSVEPNKINKPDADIASIQPRKLSHKRTSSIGTSERSDKKEKTKFLVSKKYNKQMAPISSQLSSEAMKS